jgi:hypothetical protein
VPIVSSSPAAVGLAKSGSLVLSARGLIAEPYPPVGARDNFAPPNQLLYGALVGLPAGTVVTNVCFFVSVAGSGTTPTGVFVALYSTAGTLLASSGNLNTSTQLTSLGLAALPLSAPYSVTADGGYYAAVLFNGNFGTTPMQYSGQLSENLPNAGLVGKATPTVIQSGRTALPSPATLTASDDFPYLAVS